MPTSTLHSLFAAKTWADAELLARLATLAPEQAEALQGMLRTLNHIHVVDRLFRARLAGEAEPFAATNTRETPTLDQLTADFAATDAWYEQHVATLSDAQLAEPLHFTFTDGDHGRMSREEIALHVLTHGTYHRGQVGQALKAIGAAPPRDLFTKFLHQREPERRHA